MKKKIYFVIVALLILLLAACGNDNKDTISDTTESPAAIEDDTTENVASFNFTSFNLTVETIDDGVSGDDDLVEVEYEEERNSIEAEYKDKQQDIRLTGKEAEEALTPIFTQFTFDENTPADEVIDEVLSAFNIQADNLEVDIDIDFDTGAERDYER